MTAYFSWPYYTSIERYFGALFSIFHIFVLFMEYHYKNTIESDKIRCKHSYSCPLFKLLLFLTRIQLCGSPRGGKKRNWSHFDSIKMCHHLLFLLYPHISPQYIYIQLISKSPIPTHFSGWPTSQMASRHQTMVLHTVSHSEEPVFRAWSLLGSMGWGPSL